MDWMDKIALVAAVALPLFNIPMVRRIVERKSSQDISLSWTIGVWVCIILMAPAGVRSSEVVWRAFTYANVLLFTTVVIAVLRYRKK